MLKEVLTPDLVMIDLEVESKAELIDVLLDRLCSTGKVSSRDVAKADLWANEKRTSTGMQHGIAIPHAKTNAVDGLLACVAVTRTPIEFGSVDHKPSQIFIMTLSPKDQAGPHMRFLSEIGRLLKNKKIRAEILNATTRAELLEALLR